MDLSGPLLVYLISLPVGGLIATRILQPRATEAPGALVQPRSAVSVPSPVRGRFAVQWFLASLAALLISAWAASVVSGWLLWATCALGWTLLALALMDWKWLVLADALTLPLIPAGIIVGAATDPDDLAAHLMGAIVGVAVFAGVSWIYRRWRGYDGLGFGDAKLVGAAGAWVSVVGLPSVVALAAIAALTVTLIVSGFNGSLSRTTRIPFGTYLAGATWIVWLYGPIELVPWN